MSTNNLGISKLAKVLDANQHRLGRLRVELFHHRRDLTALEVALLCREFLKLEKERMRMQILGRK